MTSTTVLDRPRKRRVEIAVGRLAVNPLVRGLFRVGVSPPMTLLLETRGRRTGALLYIPLIYLREGDRIWIIAQHGTHAGWVRNVQARPEVRVRLGRTWHTGTASLQPDDDVRARARSFAQRPFGQTMVSAMFRALESDPISLTVDLR